MESGLTSKCQITLPKEAREKLNIGPGDRVKFLFDRFGSLVILPKLPVTVVKGMVPLRVDKPVTLEEMDEAIAEGACEGSGRE